MDGGSNVQLWSKQYQGMRFNSYITDVHFTTYDQRFWGFSLRCLVST